MEIPSCQRKYNHSFVGLGPGSLCRSIVQPTTEDVDQDMEMALSCSPVPSAQGELLS